MIYAPSHVKKYLSKISENNPFFSEPIYGEFTFGYEVCCSCGKKEFIVSKNSEPKVTAYCESCGETITLYDLAEYPCAVVVEENQDEMEKITNNNNEKFNVAVVYEYSDEFPLEDEDFDENAITWCQIYLYDNLNQQSIMIVDDETA